jgi:hypothetical protein
MNREGGEVARPLAVAEAELVDDHVQMLLRELEEFGARHDAAEATVCAAPCPTPGRPSAGWPNSSTSMKSVRFRRSRRWLGLVTALAVAMFVSAGDSL